MKPKPVEPKRANFSSFDNYFHAIIQYRLELSQYHLENAQSSRASADACNQSVSKSVNAVCKACTNAFECNLVKFSASYREKVCLVFQDQAQALKSPHLYSNGNVRLPEEVSAWYERLRVFEQEHMQ